MLELLFRGFDRNVSQVFLYIKLYRGWTKACSDLYQQTWELLDDEHLISLMSYVDTCFGNQVSGILKKEGRQIDRQLFSFMYANGLCN